jgi:hypothetical protein
MAKKKLIFLIKIFILLITFTSGCIDPSKNNESITSVLTSDQAYIYNASNFETIQNDSYCLAVRGNMPENPTDNDKIEWAKSLTECFSESVPEMKQFHPNSGGFVLSYGYMGKGYIEVELGLDYVRTVNESTIDDIYQVLDEHCESNGIFDVPVVFIESHYVDEGPDYTE